MSRLLTLAGFCDSTMYLSMVKVLMIGNTPPKNLQHHDSLTRRVRRVIRHQLAALIFFRATLGKDASAIALLWTAKEREMPFKGKKEKPKMKLYNGP